MNLEIADKLFNNNKMQGFILVFIFIFNTVYFYLYKDIDFQVKSEYIAYLYKDYPWLVLTYVFAKKYIFIPLLLIFISIYEAIPKYYRIPWMLFLVSFMCDYPVYHNDLSIDERRFLVVSLAASAIISLMACISFYIVSREKV